MATISSVLKDQLAIYDQKLQELNKGIDWAYAEIGKVQAARLKLMELMEEALAPQDEERGHVVVQKMGFVDRHIEEARQLDHQPHLGPADDGTQSRLAKYGQPSEEELQRRRDNKKARDAQAYQRRKARQKERKRNTSPTWPNKVLAYVREAGEPVGYRDIINHNGDSTTEVGIKSAIATLKARGLIQNRPGLPNGTGHVAQYVPTERGWTFPIHINGA